MSLDEKMSQPEPLDPVSVTMIGTSIGLSKGTGDGGVPKGTIATTPSHLPNLVVNVVSPLVAILIRFGNLFLTTLAGLVMAGMTPNGAALLGPNDFGQLLANCASLALAPAGFGLLKDLVTIFGRLEGKYPLLTGNV